MHDAIKFITSFRKFDIYPSLFILTFLSINFISKLNEYDHNPGLITNCQLQLRPDTVFIDYDTATTTPDLPDLFL